MPKSHAEIPKAYRGRKKVKEGEDFQKRESSHVMKYYTVSSKLSNEGLEER